MSNLKGFIFGVLALAASVPALAISTQEARVFDGLINGAYTDGTANGLFFISRYGDSVLLASNDVLLMFSIDSAKKVNALHAKATVVNQSGGVVVWNRYGDYLETINPRGGVTEASYVRDFTNQEREFLAKAAAKIGAPAPKAAEPQAIRASFPCEKASTKIEKMICSDPVLAELDVTLAARYKSERTLSDDKDLSKREQRGWMKERNQCSTPQCVADSYVNRIDQLETVIRYMNKPAEFR